MTTMGKQAWSDPEKAGVMLSRTPMGRFAGESGALEVMISRPDAFNSAQMWKRW